MALEACSSRETNTKPAYSDLAKRELVMFDFDGTLANTKPWIVQTATKVLLDFGLAPDELGDVGRLVGPPFPEAFSMVYGLSVADAREVTRRYREIYADLGAKAWPLFPGVRELLEGLHRQGRKVSAASSKRQSVLERSLRDNQVLELFDLVAGKPTDDPVTKAQTIAWSLKQMGVGASDAVMVGDRHFDIDGAVACGVAGVGVDYGNTGDRDELEQAGAVAVANSVDELARLLGVDAVGQGA